MAVGDTSETRLFGGLTTAYAPMLCSFDGGECYVHSQRVWTLDETLNAGRIGAAACQSPFDGQLWISGGHFQGFICCYLLFGQIIREIFSS